MFQIDVSSAVASRPAARAAGTPGWFTGGNPVTGTAPTQVSYDWLNCIQGELTAIVTEAGIAMDKSSDAQVLAAILALFSRESSKYEALRKSFIGVPRFWRSTTLPENHMLCDGSLALFSDWPELKTIYDAGGFSGMLLAYNADAATIAANLGKWRPNSANPTGLYTPNLSDQFFRAWTGAGTAGAHHNAGLPDIYGSLSNFNIPIMSVPASSFPGACQLASSGSGNSVLSSGGTGYVWDGFAFNASLSNVIYGGSTTVMPASVDLPVCTYLGLRA